MMTIIDADYLRVKLLGRENRSHKRDYGHALLICGCDAMPGAAVLATGGALRSGCGLVTLHTTGRAATAAACQFPSAMLETDPDGSPKWNIGKIERFGSVGIGPGLGTSGSTKAAFEDFIRDLRGIGLPAVLDADAINMLAGDRKLEKFIPEGSVLTPHAGELKRLLPEWEEGKDHYIQAFCARTGCIVVSKGYHTRIFTPAEDIYENTTGNPGMAKGGSGDVLTGLITGLVARGYDTLTAAQLGVWIHGFAGDRLTEERTAESYDSRALIDQLHSGFLALERGA